MEPVTLTGKRVELAPLEAGHVQALFDASRDPAIWAFLPVRGETREDVAAFVDRALQAREKGTEFPFVIRDRQTGQIIGMTRFLDISRPDCNLEIGWTWLSPSVWRTRVNTECKYLLLRHCFETLDLVRVMLKTDKRNERSQRAIERLGAIREGILRRHRIMPDGYIRDTVVYSIIAEEWPPVKARLEGFLEE